MEKKSIRTFEKSSFLFGSNITDPDPGSCALLIPGSGISKKSGSGSGSGSEMNNLDHISQSLETIFWVKILTFFDNNPGSEIEKNSDTGWEKIVSGINIPDPQHCLEVHVQYAWGTGISQFWEENRIFVANEIFN